MATLHLTKEPPWYRQFWPWFLLTLPAVALIAGLTTLGIALRYSDAPITDHYVKNGFAVQSIVDDTAAAVQHNLRARLHLDASTGRLAVELRGDLQQRPVALIAHFVHPFDAHQDLTALLRADASGRFVGALPAVAAGRWSIQLSDPAFAAWELRATLDTRTATSVEFRP